MRILFITPLYLPHMGGLEVLSSELLAGLRSRGHDVSVLTAHLEESQAGFEVMDGIPIRRTSAHQVMRARDAVGILQIQKESWEHVRDFAPDVIHAHDGAACLWLYLRVARKGRPPVLLTLHNVMSEQYADNPEGIPGLLTLMREADWISGVSQDVVDDAIALDPTIASRVSVIRNGVVAPPGTPAPVPDGPPRFLAIGRLVEQKGFDRAIAAIARLAPRHPDVHLTIVGVGELRVPLESLVVELGMQQHVTFGGTVPRDELPARFVESVALVMPSRYEGLPLVALEAAWLRRAVVGTAAPGLDQAVSPGETGLLVDGDDPDALADAMAALITDRNHRSESRPTPRRRGPSTRRTRVVFRRVREQLRGALPAARFANPAKRAW
jgi:glycosyltransferase involved in cell wall biosynthesis